jgi:hypothetical protein
MLGCVAEISQSVPASTGQGIPGQKAGLKDAAWVGGRARRPKGESAKMYLRLGRGAGVFAMEADAVPPRWQEGRLLATDGLSRSRMGDEDVISEDVIS